LAKVENDLTISNNSGLVISVTPENFPKLLTLPI
jgi:hypothetical protein